MAQNTRMHETGSINRTYSKYNSVARDASVSGAVSTAAEKIGEAVASRNRRIARERASAPIIVKKRVKASPFPMSFVFYSVVMTVMLMFVVYSNSVVNEVSYEINDLETKISAAEQENEKLSIALDKKYDLADIERIATTELGLVKSTDVVKHYVSISGGDKVTVSKDEKASYTKLDATLDSLKESVAKIYE